MQAISELVLRPRSIEALLGSHVTQLHCQPRQPQHVSSPREHPAVPGGPAAGAWQLPGMRPQQQRLCAAQPLPPPDAPPADWPAGGQSRQMRGLECGLAHCRQGVKQSID